MVVFAKRPTSLFGIYCRCSCVCAVYMIAVIFLFEVYLRETDFEGIARLSVKELRVSSVVLQSDVITQKSHKVKKFMGNRSSIIDRDLVGYIWPKADSLDDRIVNQMDFMKEYAAIRGDTRMKTIVRVGNFNFDHLMWKDGQEGLIKGECPVKDCIYSSDKRLAKVADALLISEFSGDLLQFYTPKPAHQIWITQHLEPPHHNRINTSSLSDLVNWTASYRHDSTLVLQYGAWERRNAPGSESLLKINFAKGKRKKVAWFVSNCADPRNGRLQYATELKKYIAVDIYGSCGNLSCPRFGGNVSCQAMLKRDYKFYLSFENSNCVGYITEKFHWNALANDVVPIVMGARPQDYAFAAPPGSYIHVDDFESPRHLADYLKVLDSNDTLYNEYFKYKQHWKVMSWRNLRGGYWCRLCALVHLKDDANYVHWYKDYNKWWNGACYARQDGNNTWQTWRPQGYWNNGSRAVNVKDTVDKELGYD